MKKIYFLATFLILGISVFSQTTFFTYNAVWKYEDNGSNQGTAWRAAGFNDSTWQSGSGQLGYGDGDEGTILNACGTVTQYPSCTNKYIGYYFRKAVNIPNVNLFQNFKFNMYRDDGVVIYVNGTEVYRNNMPTGTISYNTTASSAATDDGNTMQTATLSVAASLLVSGDNTIAVEVHQNAGSSSDLTWSLELVGMPAPVGGALVTRGPYLQKASSTGITLRWRTDNAVNSKVRYGTDSLNLNDSVVAAGTRTEHTVALSGLQPFTKYYYSIGSSAGVMQGSGQNNFVTSPIPGTPGKYTFWVAGDCGNNSTNQANVRDRYNTYIGNNVTNGWLLLGDNAYSNGTDAEYTAKFFNLYQSTIMKHAPLWPVPGNHDYDNGSSARQNDHAIPYYDIFDLPSNGESGGVASNTEAFYSYDYGNIHFLSLDSYGKEDNSTRLYDTLGAQVQWIKADLAANDKKWVVAYWHHPPYTMGSHNSDTESELVSMRSNFIRILERLGVDLIMCGHSHDYERTKLIKGHYGNEASFNSAVHNLSQSSGVYDGTANSCTYLKDSLHNTLTGTVYVLSGSAGQLGGTQASFPHAAMHYSNATNGGSFVLEFDDNRLDAKWLCADGIIRDKFTIIKDASKVHSYNVDLGDSINLSASWNGQYNWPHSGATTQSVNVVPAVSGDYIVTDQYQCVTDTFKVIVNIPSVAAATPAITNICAGSTVNIPYTITGRFFSGNTFTAQLSDASGSFASPVAIGTNVSTAAGSILATIPAGALTGANYRIRIVSSVPAITGAATATDLIIDNGIPSITFTSSDTDNSICEGEAVTFTGSGAHTYEFLLNGTSLGAASATATYSTAALANGDVIEVKGFNACGDNTSTITTQVTGIPVANIVSSDADNSICEGTAVTFTASGGTVYEFFVDGVSQGAASMVNTFSTSALANGQAVTVKGSNACFNDSASITVTVNALPVLSLAGSDTDNIICLGQDVTFTSSGADTYEFFVNGTSQGAATTTNFFSSATLGNNDQVVVEGTSLEGCESASSAVSITVNPLPAVTVNAAGATTFCAGDSVMLTAITTETNYLWNTGAITQSIYVTASGNYNATVTSANNCSETSSQINVQVNALPSAPVISQSGNVLTSDALTGNQWYFNGAIIAGATSQTYTATADGSYTVIVTDANGCSSAESGPVSVIITGIEVLNSFGGLAVYPNPFSDQLIISYSLKNASKTTIELTDISGKLIAKLLDQRMTDAGEHRITLNAKDYALKNGLYLLKVSTAEGSQIVRINYIP